MRTNRNKLAGLSTLILLLTGGLLFITGTLAGPSEGGSLTIFFSGDIRGNYAPCGCEGHPAGGISRRLAHVRSYRESHDGPIIQVDVGNYLEHPGLTSAPINELMFQSLDALPIQVMNLGSQDLYYWKSLQSLETKTRFISTNLIPRKKTVPGPRRFAIVEIPAARLGLDRPLRIGFLGLVDPSRVKPNSGLRAMDPLEAVAQVKNEVLARADFLVVLADLPREANEFSEDSLVHKLASRHDEIAAILMTERRYVLFPAQLINQAVVLSSVERGRQLASLTISLDRQGSITEFGNDFAELEEGVPEDTEWKLKQDVLSARFP